MANLSGIAMDKDVQESTGSFTVIPAGKYKACLVADELRDNNAGTGKVLAVKVQILEGQNSGHVLTDYINITNPNPKAQSIGQGTLKRICNLCGVTYPPQDTAGMMGKPLGVDVKVEEFTSNNSVDENGNPKKLKSNKINAYGPPPVATQAAQHQSPPQPAANTVGGW